MSSSDSEFTYFATFCRMPLALSYRSDAVVAAVSESESESESDGYQRLPVGVATHEVHELLHFLVGVVANSLLPQLAP